MNKYGYSSIEDSWPEDVVTEEDWLKDELLENYDSIEQLYAYLNKQYEDDYE